MTGQQNKTKEGSSFLQELLHPQINTVYRVRGGVDRIFLIIVVLLLCYGSVMVFSSSYVFAKVRMHDSLWFVKKQIFFAIVGIIVMMIVSFIDYGFIKKFIRGKLSYACGSAFYRAVKQRRDKMAESRAYSVSALRDNEVCVSVASGIVYIVFQLKNKAIQIRNTHSCGDNRRCVRYHPA